MSDKYFYRVSYTFHPVNNSYIQLGYFLWDSHDLIKKHLFFYTLTESLTKDYVLVLPSKGVYYWSPVLDNVVLKLHKLVYSENGVSSEEVHSPNLYKQIETKKEYKAHVTSPFFKQPSFTKSTRSSTKRKNQISENNPNQYSIADKLESVVNNNFSSSPEPIPNSVSVNDFTTPIYNSVFRLVYSPKIFNLQYEDYEYKITLLKVERVGINSIKVYSYWEVSTIDSYYTMYTHYPASFEHIIEVSNDRGFSKTISLNTNVNKIHRVHSFNHLPFGEYKVRIKLNTNDLVIASPYSKLISLFSNAQEVLSYEN